MRSRLRSNVIYMGILLSVAGMAYYGGQSNWLSSLTKNPTTPKASLSQAGKSARSTFIPLEQAKAQLTKLLEGNWPKSVATNAGKHAFLEALFLQGPVKPQDVPALLAILHDLPESNDKQIIIYEIVARLAGSKGFQTGGEDPALAIQLLGSLSDQGQRKQLMEIALETLSTIDARQTLSVLASLPSGYISPQYYKNIFSNMARRYPEDVAALVANLPPGDMRNNAMQGLAQGWLMINPQAAVQWAVSLRPEDSAVIDDMIQRLASSNSALAASYLQKMTDPVAISSTIQTISLKMATGPKADPASALAWLNQAATGSAYNSAVASLFSGLASPSVQTSVGADGMTRTFYSYYKQNIPLAISMLANVTDPSAHQAAITSIAKGWAKSDPQAALTWAESLADSSAALKSVVTVWASADPASAVAYVKKSPAPENFLSIAPALAQKLATTDPQAALVFGQSLPAGEIQTAALGNALIGLAGSNFTAAWTVVAGLPPGESHDAILANLVTIQAEKNPEQAAVLIATIPDVETQLMATSKLATTWLKLDPRSFTIWLNGLPPGDMRDTAITQLVSSPQAAKDPAGVMQWVSTVSNQQIKVQLLRKLGQN